MRAFVYIMPSFIGAFYMNYLNNKNFGKVVSYMYKNIDQPLKLENIAHEAGLSLSSLKRLFQEGINQSPGCFIRRLRMELAFKSLQSKQQSILEIALASGFEDHAAFSRKFKEIFGYPPSHARQKQNIVNEFESVTLEEPEIVDLNKLEIQRTQQVGLYYESAPRAWEIIRNKLNSEELSDDFAGVFIGIGHDNPHDGTVKEDEVRYTAGVAFIERDLGLDRLMISSGKYARFRFVGKPANMGLAYHYIYGKWEQTTFYKIDHTIPAFCILDTIADGLKEHRILINVPVIEK